MQQSLELEACGALYLLIEIKKKIVDLGCVHCLIWNTVIHCKFVCIFQLKITFGGIPFSGKPSSSSRKNFKGCMESINYNGINITDLARRKKLEPSNVVRILRSRNIGL